jgi:16S rRNA (guanine527-N7)-methyltransferase
MLADQRLLSPDARVLDVGSGAGAPALPVALLRPDLGMTLVEPLHKRVAFMRHAIGTLKLGDRVTVLERKLELGGDAPRGAPFDVAMSRATLAPEEWLALGLLHAHEVLVLGVPGKDPRPESARALDTVTYALPSSSAPRAIWKYERIEP